MSRQAQAHLVVTVADQPLVDHIKRVSDAKTAWEGMVAAISGMSGKIDPNMGTAFEGLGKGLAGFSKVDPTKLEGAATALSKMGGKHAEFDKLKTALDGLDGIMQKLWEPTKKWADQLQRASSNVDKLDDRISKLIQSQQATERHLDNFEGKLKQANDALKAQGAEILKLVQGYAGFNKAVDVAAAKQKQAKKETESWTDKAKGLWNGIANMERAFIRTATTFFIVGQWFKHGAEAFRSAATEIDLSNVLSKNVAGWQQIMEDTQRATKGMVSNLQILKSGALMSSFGIPINNLAENMGIIQKLAVRTGQDTQYMFDSLARGVSRLSPAILDNLGLQIKLNDAYSVYAARMGKSVDSMDAFEKKQAVLAEVMRQATDLTQGVSPEASLAGRLDAAAAKWDNWWNSVKGAILEGVMLLTSTEDQRLGIIHDKLAIRIKEIKEYGHVVTKTMDDLMIATEFAGQKSIDIGKLRRTTFAGFGLTIGSALNPNVMNTLRESSRQHLIAEGKIYDIRNMTLEEQEELLKKKERELRLVERMGFLYKEQKNALKEFTDAILDGEPTSGAVAGLADITTMIGNLGAGWDRIDQIRANMSKFRSEDTRFASLYKAELSDALRLEERKIQSLSEQAKAGNILARAILFSYDTSKFMDGIEQAALKRAQDKYAISREMEAVDRRRLMMAESSVRYAQQELEGITGAEVAIRERTRLEAELAKAQEEYNKRQEQALVWGKENASYTVAEVESQAELVAYLSERLQLVREIADLAQFTVDFVKDQSFWTKQMKLDEAERLSGGMSQAEIQTELVVLQRILTEELDKQKVLQQDIADIMETQSDEASLLAGLLIAQNVRSQADMIIFANRAKELKKILDLFGSGGGGGGRGGGIKKDLLTVEEDIHTSMRNISDMGHDLLVVRGQEVQKMWVWIGDTLHAVSTTVKEVSRDVFRAQGFDSKGGIFGGILKGDAVGALEANEEKLKRLDKLGAKGGWDDNMIATRTQIELQNEALREHIAMLTGAAQAMRDYGAASDDAFKHAQGILGDDVLRSMDALARNVAHLGEVMDKASKGQASSYDIWAAGLGTIRSFTAEYIKNLRARAAVEMLYNAGMSWAAAGSGNTPGAIAHATAALMFGAVASGAVRLPGQARGDDRRAAERTGGPIHLHLYSEMAMTDAERGSLIDRAISQAAAEGRI